MIIDEEQRFGVKHKERLKELKTQVDVLTLTATPIPRTPICQCLGFVICQLLKHHQPTVILFKPMSWKQTTVWFVMPFERNLSWWTGLLCLQ